ncbi:MAG: MerR family transcriptional regulator [Geodermatophilaceae bacterium]|nr:MerR family transcriptional regulator [Geodermatophilaceae bacterium]
MANGLMSIGTFSRASLLSIKALRAYHAAGILVPAEVDPATGYRAYLATQLADAAVLRRLRALDLPLSDVGEILRARDPDRTRKILTGHGELLQERLARIAQAVDEIHSSIEHPASLTPVYVRDEPAIQIVEYRGQVREADFPSFLDTAYAALYALLGRLGVRPNGPSGALYPPVVDDVEEVVAYVPIAAEAQLPDDRGPMALGEVPAATVAVLTHHGGYDSIADTYQLLGRWVAEHAVSADLQVREAYVISPADHDDPERYRTDICWPLDRWPSTTEGKTR